MAEKPILFSTEMVKAILAGRKTQTRRVIKPQPHIDSEGMCKWRDCQWMADGRIGFPVTAIEDYAPYQPGDVLWVRETWADLRGMGFGYDPRTDKPFNFAYRADTKPGSDGDRIRKEYGIKWKPSIHMPREAARIFLRVTDVRVERLQDISYDDCLREGMWNCGTEVDTLAMFQELWQTLNAKRGFGWETNCWVWVISFEVVS